MKCGGSAGALRRPGRAGLVLLRERGKLRVADRLADPQRLAGVVFALEHLRHVDALTEVTPQGEVDPRGDAKACVGVQCSSSVGSAIIVACVPSRAEGATTS